MKLTETRSPGRDCWLGGNSSWRGIMITHIATLPKAGPLGRLVIEQDGIPEKRVNVDGKRYLQGTNRVSLVPGHYVDDVNRTK